MSAMENLSSFTSSVSLEAQVLRQAYDDEGLSNPIGIFICPHCQQAADVEYETPSLDFPSGTPARTHDPIDAARCFRCGEVSYWLLTDFDRYNTDGRDWRDFPRVLIYPVAAASPGTQGIPPKAPTEQLAGNRMLLEMAGSIKGLEQEPLDAPTAPTMSQSVSAPEGTRADAPGFHNEGRPLTFRTLADLYIAERQGNVTEGTMKSIRTDCNILSAALGGLNMRTHTRADMVALKAKVVEGRKDLTINKVLTRLSTVCTWAVNSGYLDKTYEKGLKLANAESGREAFSSEQIEPLMAHANSLAESDWKRWALSLGVITGARIGELYQLNKRDIREAGGVWVMDVNNEGEKTLKNKHSVRCVPLTDGAYGFDLMAFLAWAERSKGRLFTAKEHYFNKPLNDLIRSTLGLESGANQTFHSLRHNLAGSLRAVETPAATAQDILGHSSGSISYDLYGAGSSVAVERMAKALKLALLVDGDEAPQRSEVYLDQAARAAKTHTIRSAPIGATA